MMQVYLVRRLDTGNLLGLFWAPNLDELWNLADAAGTDPSDYEYAAIGGGRGGRGGALYNELPSDVPPPPQDGDFPDGYDGTAGYFGSFIAEEGFSEILHNLSRQKWRRFDFSTEGHGMIAQIMREFGSDNDTERAP